MLFGLYSYHDALNGFMNVFIERSDKIAVRGFQSAMATADVTSLFYSNPTDYCLFKVGVIDLETGKIEPEIAPVLLVRGAEKVE